MIRLLKAGLFRLKKDILFWLFIFLTIGLAVFTLVSYIPMEGVTLDNALNNFIAYIGLFIAIFVSIFVGKEYSQGIIRNKIIVGHSRASIFLTNLIISIIVSLLCEIIYLTIIFLFGRHLLGQLQMALSNFIGTLANTVLIIVSFCSIYNFITMLCSEITISTTICIVLFIAMFVAQGTFSLIAHSNKYIENVSYDKEGNKHIISQEIDPKYPGEQKIKIAKIIYLAIPQGQAMEIKNNNLDSLQQMNIYSIILIGVINILGIYIFSKKDLK